MTARTQAPVNDSKALTPAQETYRAVTNILDQRHAQFDDLLQGAIPFERFRTVALHAINSNPELLTATPYSLAEAIREAAALHLEPTGLLGDAYLVKYGDNARLMPGYRGLMKLARRSGDVVNLDTQVVYEGDEFEISLGTAPMIVHNPRIEGDRGGYRGAYAWARLKTGELVIEWMTEADINQVRETSRAKNSGPWVSFWQEMARKTAMRRLMKRLPLTIEGERAIELDAEAEHAAGHEAPPTERVNRIRERMQVAQERTPPNESAQADQNPIVEATVRHAPQAEPINVTGSGVDERVAPDPVEHIPPDVQAGMDLLDPRRMGRR